MDYNSDFNFSGKIATTSNFWAQPTSNFVSGDSLTTGFRKVIGEQFFAPIRTPNTVFYTNLVENAIVSGSGFTERMLNRSKTRTFTGKATSEDALGFEDSKGIERTFPLNISGWRRMSVPSDMFSGEMMTTPAGIASFNSYLYDSQIAGYQRDMESIFAMYAVSMTKSEKTIAVGTEPTSFFDEVGALATDMLGDKVAYNELTNVEQQEVYTGADRILAFIDAKIYNKIRSRLSYLPDANRIVENVEFVPVVDGLPRPLTTPEFNSGTGVISWTVKPVAVDKEQPQMLICDKRKFGYRPYRESYKVKEVENAAGDFTNYHLLYRGALYSRPWYNAVRVKLTGI